MELEGHDDHGLADVDGLSHVLGHELVRHLAVSHFWKRPSVYRLTFKLAAVVTLVQAAVNSYAALFAERHAVGASRD